MDSAEQSSLAADAVDGYRELDDPPRSLEQLPPNLSRVIGEIDHEKGLNELKELIREESQRLRLYKTHENMLKTLGLPEEILVKILESLNLKDRENCKVASPYLKKITLTTRRAEFLFSSVAEILVSKYELNYNTIIMCRQVCKSWKEGVDFLYEKCKIPGTMKTFEDPRKHSDTKFIGSMTDKYRISNIDEAKNFWNHFYFNPVSNESTLPKNPFVIKYVNFINKDLIAPAEGFYNEIWSILKNSGNDIWHCSIAVGTGRSSNTQCYSWFRALILLMPNLKFLHILSVRRSNLSAEFLYQNPLPTLTSLEELKLENVDYDIANEIIQQNSQILRLSVFRVPKIDDDVCKSLKKLQELKSVDSELGYQIVNEFGLFPSLSMINIATNEDSFSGPALFGILEDTCFTTLTELKISNPLKGNLDSSEELEFSKTGRLSLPYLRSLKLSLWDNYGFFLDFILPTQTNLQHLQINAHLPGEVASNSSRCRIIEKVKHEQIIQFRGFQENMSNSNIWQLFPKLLTLVLKGSETTLLYTRKNQNKPVSKSIKVN